MKISKLIQIFLLTTLLIGVSFNTAEAKIQTLQIHNNTGYTVKALYFAPKGSNFGNERIADAGYSTLEDGEYLSLLYEDSYPAWCLKIVFANGAARIWNRDRALDMSGVHKISIVSGGKDRNGIENFSVRKN